MRDRKISDNRGDDVQTSPFPGWVRTVGVFAPAGVPELAKLDAGLGRLRDWGVEVVVAGAWSCPERYLSAPDSERVAAFHELLRNPQIDLLIAARGGYGCGRLLDKVDWSLVADRQLPIVGFSDITALHLAAWHAGLRESVFGPMLTGLFARCDSDAAEKAKVDFSLASFRAAWESGGVALPGDAALRVLRPGQGRGPVVPATLSVLASLLGTPFMPSLKQALLVLEDVNEPAYKIDRYLTQLRVMGILEQLSGLIFGTFRDSEDAQWMPAIFAEFAGYVSGPVVEGLPFGHCCPSVSLPVGRIGSLDAGESDARLRLE